MHYVNEGSGDHVWCERCQQSIITRLCGSPQLDGALTLPTNLINLISSCSCEQSLTNQLWWMKRSVKYIFFPRLWVGTQREVECRVVYLLSCFCWNDLVVNFTIKLSDFPLCPVHVTLTRWLLKSQNLAVRMSQREATWRTNRSEQQLRCHGDVPGRIEALCGASLTWSVKKTFSSRGVQTLQLTSVSLDGI